MKRGKCRVGGASVGLVVLDVTRGEAQPRTRRGCVDDSHLQQPREAGAVAAAAAGTAAVLAVSRLLSVRVGSVDMEEPPLAEEGVEVWCWWRCGGLLLTVAPVLLTPAVP